MKSVVEILEHEGFLPTSPASQKVATALESAFTKFGEDIAGILMEHLSVSNKLPIDVILAQYEIIEKSINTLFGHGAAGVMIFIKEELLKNFPEANKDATPREIVNAEYESEALNFLKTVPKHEHVAILFSDTSFISRALSAFSSSSESSFIVSNSYSSKKPGVISLSYDTLFSSAKPEQLSKSVTDLFSNLKSRTSTGCFRVAGDDTYWFMENGYAQEFLEIEASIGPKPKEDMVAMCSYYLPKMNDNKIAEVVRNHSYVILDSPALIYSNKRFR